MQVAYGWLPCNTFCCNTKPVAFPVMTGCLILATSFFFLIILYENFEMVKNVDNHIKKLYEFFGGFMEFICVLMI